MIKLIHKHSRALFKPSVNTIGHYSPCYQYSTLSDHKQLYKFCITGGPCAGKTTAMTHLSNVLSQFGFRVFCVPEAATLFSKGGAMINLKDFTFD